LVFSGIQHHLWFFKIFFVPQHVSNLESLEERLLCVEVSGMDVVLIMAVMKEVARIASFVRFLPLANRV